MTKIIYRSSGIDSIDTIEPLWNRLHEHHRQSPEFQRIIQPSFGWSERRERLISRTESEFFILTARSNEEMIGYCFSSLDQNMSGEVESLYVSPDFRGLGVGAELTRKNVDWLKEKQARSIRLFVAVGNEAALSFYERLGFLKRATILQYDL